MKANQHSEAQTRIPRNTDQPKTPIPRMDTDSNSCESVKSVSLPNAGDAFRAVTLEKAVTELALCICDVRLMARRAE